MNLIYLYVDLWLVSKMLLANENVKSCKAFPLDLGLLVELLGEGVVGIALRLLGVVE